MNRINQILLGAVMLLLLSCQSDDEVFPPSTSKNVIMPLGASRVEGARPDFESYRYELWKRMIEDDWDIDYIGTKEDPADYPDYAGLSFDDDHEGRGGWTSGQILEGVEEWLSRTGAPDIVLFSSPGGNDGLQGLPFVEAVANIHAVIDILQAENPEVTIVIEQMAPAHSSAMTPELTTFFQQMQQEVITIATEQSTSTSQVLTVDMASGFEDAFFADDVHYSQAGAEFVANQYYEVLQAVLVE